MARYQSQYGLKPIGPHRPMADRLLTSLSDKCKMCDGRGLRDRNEGSEVCKTCRGLGAFFTRPALEIHALRQRILSAYPDAAAEPVPNFSAGLPALDLAKQEIVDLSQRPSQDSRWRSRSTTTGSILSVTANSRVVLYRRQELVLDVTGGVIRRICLHGDGRVVQLAP
jgi:hypothetical protein